MTEAKQILAAEFETLKNDIIARYEASGSRATGNWATTLQVNVTDTSATITGADYLEGRGPGKQPPSKAILQWINAKGIATKAEKDINLSSLAFLIARKIGREGWQPQQKGSDIIAAVATPERMQQIINRVGDAYINRFSNEIINFLKQHAVL